MDSGVACVPRGLSMSAGFTTVAIAVYLALQGNGLTSEWIGWFGPGALCLLEAWELNEEVRKKVVGLNLGVYRSILGMLGWGGVAFGSVIPSAKIGTVGLILVGLSVPLGLMTLKRRRV